MLIAIAIVVASIFLVQYATSIDCRRLRAIEGSPNMVEELLLSLMSNMRAPNVIESSRGDHGILYMAEMTGNFGIDWEAFGIPEDRANVEFVGNGLRYRNFDFELVDEIRVGSGSRSQLIFRYKNADDPRFPLEANLREAFDVNIECRK